MKKLLLLAAITLSINVFGQDVKTVKIGDLEVMTEDLGRMDWKEAKKACADLGDDWRLPTKDELNVLHENMYKIGGFRSNYYWSSQEFVNGNVWRQDFSSGDQNDGSKAVNCYVRAVRAF